MARSFLCGYAHDETRTSTLWHCSVKRVAPSVSPAAAYCSLFQGLAHRSSDPLGSRRRSLQDAASSGGGAAGSKVGGRVSKDSLTLFSYSDAAAGARYGDDGAEGEKRACTHELEGNLMICIVHDEPKRGASVTGVCALSSGWQAPLRGKRRTPCEAERHRAAQFAHRQAG